MVLILRCFSIWLTIGIKLRAPATRLKFDRIKQYFLILNIVTGELSEKDLIYPGDFHLLCAIQSLQLVS